MVKNACDTFGCNHFGKGNFNYCSNHKCIIGSCDNEKAHNDGYDYCWHHKCNRYNCSNKGNPNKSGYCSNECREWSS